MTYIDWANSRDDDGPELSPELANDRRTIYLVPESVQEPDLASLIEEFWEQIFEEELAAWMLDEQTWPTPLSREMFEAWFGSEVTSSVFDLCDRRSAVGRRHHVNGRFTGGSRRQ